MEAFGRLAPALHNTPRFSLDEALGPVACEDSVAVLHPLTVGHLDPAAIERRQIVSLKSIDMIIVHHL